MTDSTNSFWQKNGIMLLQKKILALGGTVFMTFWLTSALLAGEYYRYGPDHEKVWMERMDTRLYLELEDGKTLEDVKHDILNLSNEVTIDSISEEEVRTRLPDETIWLPWVYLEGENLDKADFTEVEGITFEGWFFKHIEDGHGEPSWLHRGFNFKLKEDNGKEKFEEFVDKYNLQVTREFIPGWYNLRVVEKKLNSEYVLNLANKSFEEGYSSIGSPSLRGGETDDTSIENEEGHNNLEEKIRIFPNPGQNFIKVATREDHLIARVEIYFLNGQKVKGTELVYINEVEIPVIDLPNGQYIIRIGLKGGGSFQEKFMIAK